MALQVTGQAQGLVLGASQKSGAPPALSTGWHNELLVSELLPRYASLVLAGNVFFAHSQSAQALVTLTTGQSTGLSLVNPPNSIKNCVLLQVEFSPTTAPAAAAAAVCLAIQPYSALVSATIGNQIARNALIGAAATAVGIATTSATLQLTPIAAKILATFLTSTATQINAVNPTIYDIGGSIILAPGTAACICNSTGAVTGIAAMLWAELPV
jgi:hypothetical protein